MPPTLLDPITGNDEPFLWWIPPDEWHPGARQDPAGLLPGSFNPLHEGHLALCQVAATRLGGTVASELSIVNADKPPLTTDEVERRCRQFTAQSVVVTTAATFTEKSRLFPGVTFIVGADTASRAVDLRYYQGDVERRDAALTELRNHGCSFLVAARLWNGQLLTLDDLAIPRCHLRLFSEIPADEFRFDLSSTDLRNGPELRSI